jgi:hypothetical protein
MTTARSRRALDQFHHAIVDRRAAIGANAALRRLRA